jgi:hypothetical protein
MALFPSAQEGSPPAFRLQPPEAPALPEDPRHECETYGFSPEQAYKARVKGFFLKNYSKKQMVIDRGNFNQAICYPLAKRVYAKNFKRNPLARSLYDDMVQEAVTGLFELSGKTKEMANGKYSENYASFWIAHNAMPAFLKTWKRQSK